MAKTVQKEQMATLDKTDLAILKLLQENARITIKEISEKVHLSTTPVHERIKRMEESGVIKQYVTVLNASKVGKGLMVICYVSLRQHSKNAGEKFIKGILEMNEVLECHHITGQDCYLVKIAATSIPHLEQVIGRFAEFTHTVTTIVLSSPVQNRVIKPSGDLD